MKCTARFKKKVIFPRRDECRARQNVKARTQEENLECYIFKFKYSIVAQFLICLTSKV